MAAPDPATDPELGARFVAAREQAPTFEAEQMLAQLGERMFGVTAEPLRLGRFAVLRRLGAGGMGVVYLGYDAELDRKVALKLLRLRSPDVRAHATARLGREARALARVDHPNVIAVHEVGTHEDDVFLAMDLVEGVTLACRSEQPQLGRPRRTLLAHVCGERIHLQTLLLEFLLSCEFYRDENQQPRKFVSKNPFLNAK